MQADKSIYQQQSELVLILTLLMDCRAEFKTDLKKKKKNRMGWFGWRWVTSAVRPAIHNALAVAYTIIMNATTPPPLQTVTIATELLEKRHRGPYPKRTDFHEFS